MCHTAQDNAVISTSHFCVLRGFNKKCILANVTKLCSLKLMPVYSIKINTVLDCVGPKIKNCAVHCSVALGCLILLFHGIQCDLLGLLILYMLVLL